MTAVAELQAHLDATPSPFHCVELTRDRLTRAGFAEISQPSDWTSEVAHGSGFVARDGAIVAWVGGNPSAGATPGAGRFIGAHTDSPGLRVRPRPDTGGLGYRQIGVEVYGSPILASWADRDLGLAGRVAVRTKGVVEFRTFRTEHAVMRIPLLAIHLDRESNDGLRLDRQQHLTPIWSLGDPSEGDFVSWLADVVGCPAADVISWDALAYDTQPALVIGAHGEFLASARLDNQASCFGAIQAILAHDSLPSSQLAVIALFDHEEVGSTTATGADGSWFSKVLERRALAAGQDRATWLDALGQSKMLSADMAHAVHPNYPERHDPAHRVQMGGGPVIKYNSNARYATSASSAAAFKMACASVGMSTQDYSHHGALPCGSTIGPLVAAGLAVDTVDVGMAQLSMHSVRELMATADVELMVRSFTAWLANS